MVNYTKELAADVVIIGSGSAGLCGALTAASGGARVIILEKLPAPGGTSVFAEGTFAVESKMQKKQKIGITVEQAFDKHMASTAWGANARLVRAYMDKSASTIEWLESMGAEFRGVSTIFPDGPLVWHMCKKIAGTSLIKPLFNRVQGQKNIQVLLETSAKKLVMEENKVVGVLAESKQGEEVKITCAAVIIASGGYQDNPEWMNKYCQNASHMTTFVDMKQDGGPIQMAWDVGAAKERMGFKTGFTFVPDENNLKSHLLHAGMQPFLWVNAKGERFCNEAIVWKFPWAMNALGRQPRAEAYCCFDENTKKFMEEHGIFYFIGEFLDPTSRLTELDRQLTQGISSGKVFQGDSVKELAEKIGADVSVMQSEVDTYNECCARNHDFIFNKDRVYLQPIIKPKFYAVKIACKLLGTFGGIKINHKTEVIDEKLNVIPGLYAAGICTGGILGDSYVLDSMGSALGFATNSGRMAGESALRYIRRVAPATEF